MFKQLLVQHASLTRAEHILQVEHALCGSIQWPSAQVLHTTPRTCHLALLQRFSTLTTEQLVAVDVLAAHGVRHQATAHNAAEQVCALRSMVVLLDRGRVDMPLELILIQFQ